MDWSIEMGEAWRLTHWRILLLGLGDRVWFLGERVHRWWDGPFLRRVPMAPPCEGFHLSYIMTLVVQLIDAAVGDFTPLLPPSQVDPTHPSTSRGETAWTS